jgi:hypothetical protein
MSRRKSMVAREPNGRPKRVRDHLSRSNACSTGPLGRLHLCGRINRGPLGVMRVTDGGLSISATSR